MLAASGIASASSASPALAEEAINGALTALSINRADQVLLFLSEEFGSDIAAALRIAVATSGTLRVSGMRTHGLFTEKGWEIDRPAAAAMVISYANEQPVIETEAPILSFSSLSNLQPTWCDGPHRAGLLSPNTLTWQSGRITQTAEDRIACRQPPRQIYSRGFRSISPQLTVTEADGRAVFTIADQPACEILRRALPPGEKSLRNLHRIRLFRDTSDAGINILSELPGRGLLLSEPLIPGSSIFFGLRHPLASAQEIRGQMRAAAERVLPLSFALMFSCVGRGPLFYGDEDADLLAFREHFPRLPLLGAYGNDQIIRGDQKNILSHNSVLTLLYENPLNV